jgi:hypothetical protein
MIADVKAPKSVFNQVLNSISAVITGDEDQPQDLNLVAKEGVVEIYVRQHSVQVMHKLTTGGDVEISVENEREFVFSSRTLSSIISRTPSDTVDLSFGYERFEVKVGDSWFTTPTKFELPLYRESEFSEAIRPEGYHKVTHLDTEALRSTLRMMENISPDVVFRITDEEFWITVSDQVQGEGEVMKELDDDVSLSGVEFRYEITAINDFLKNLEAEKVLMKMSETGSLMITTQHKGYVSQLLIAPRIEYQKPTR